MNNVFLICRWSCISKRDVQAWGGDVQGNFKFEFFVYVQKRARAGSAPMRRATQARILAAHAAIQQHYPNLGPIQKHLFSVHQARLPPVDRPVLPTTPAMRQAAMLDNEALLLQRRNVVAQRQQVLQHVQPQQEDETQRQEAAQCGDRVQGQASQGNTNAGQQQHAQAQQQQHTAIPVDESEAPVIQVKLFGAWVGIQVSLFSLRAALRLPQHDIFSEGIFHTYNPQLPEPAENIEDIDHAGRIPATEP